VVYDASHSVQQPGIDDTGSGGESEYIPTLAKAATAVGIDALFIETHPNPDKAISDGKNSLKISNMEELLNQVIKINAVVKNME
jgi:2-dehydro-3-deoxyphosphooctonate aldolase (KDO 8-P synthase)